MATLTWADVAIIAGVATVGFTLLSYWYSGLMSRKGWSYQVRGKARKDEAGPAAKPPPSKQG